MNKINYASIASKEELDEMKRKYFNCLTDLGCAKFDIKNLKKIASEILTRYTNIMEFLSVSINHKNPYEDDINNFKKQIEEI